MKKMIRTIASRRPHPPAAAPATATTDKLPETFLEIETTPGIVTGVVDRLGDCGVPLGWEYEVKTSVAAEIAVLVVTPRFCCAANLQVFTAGTAEVEWTGAAVVSIDSYFLNVVLSARIVEEN
jgi:hypothetical protein